MKKILVLSVVLMMALMASPSIIADDPVLTDGTTHNTTPGISTSVTINQGAGHAPWIKCKWETVFSPSNAANSWKDSDLVATGIQIDPVLEGTKTVYYYALVTDYEGVDGISKVYADVYHPDGQFKYQFELVNKLTTAKSLEVFDAVYTNNPSIMTFSTIDPYGYYTDYAEAREEILQAEAYIWWGQNDLSYCQPAGLYEVRVTARDIGNLWATDLINHFWYVPTIGVTYDFYSVNYGSAIVDIEKQLGGDYDMGTPDAPTVRNIGNVPIQFNITQDDMGLGMTGTDWNVKYGARLGNAIDATKVEYFPEEVAIVPDILPLCTLEKFDFFITVFKAPLTEYSGVMTIGASMFGDPATAAYVTPSQFVQD